MGYVSSSDRGPTRRATARYPSSCMTGGGTLQREFATHDHYVTSYRGPIEVIKVGSKRRRVFRAFSISKYYSAELSKDSWCPAPGKYWGGSDAIQHQFLKRIEDNRDNVRPQYREGSKYPMLYLGDFKPLTIYQRDEVEHNLYEKLKDPRFDGAVFLAELGETLVSIQSLFLGAIKAFTKAGKIIDTVKHFSLNSEELWLWYRYFLLPAMMDAEDLLKAIKPQASIDRVQSGKPKKTITTSGSVYNTDGIFTGYHMEIPWKQVTTYRSGGAIDVLKRLDPSEWGLSAIDIMRAGWEIIPFSFVFDWFIDLGSFLTTLRNVDIEYAQSYATYALESEITFMPGPDAFMSSGEGKIRRVFIERIIDLEPPTHPRLTREWTSVHRTVDAIALSAGIIKNVLARGKSRR